MIVGNLPPRDVPDEKGNALAIITLTITKASLGPDGSMRWQATASDTGPDNYGERTSLGLFRDWIERIEKNITVPFLPPPRRPFLGVSHYPSLDDFGEAGATERMFIDGDQFKASGPFLDTPIGKALFQAVRQELEMIRHSGHVVGDHSPPAHYAGRDSQIIQEPIRISAAWWDLQHSHGTFVFTRKSLQDMCPVCAQGTGDKIYLKGQLDHFAGTRVPVHPRTALELEEKSVKRKTRRADAASIVGEELADELEVRARQLVGKAETDDDTPEGLIIKAEGDDAMIRKVGEKWVLFSSDGKKELGKFDSKEAALKRERQIQFFKHQKADLKADLALAEGTVFTAEEMAEICPDCARAMVGVGIQRVDLSPTPTEGLTEKAGNIENLAKHMSKKYGGDPGFFTKCMGSSELSDYDQDKRAAICARAHKIAIGKWPAGKADVEKDMGPTGPSVAVELVEPWRPFGGATSLQEAEDYVKAQDLSNQLYSNWDMLQAVMGNILNTPDDQELDKVETITTAIQEFGDRVAALKAGISDAYLLLPIGGESMGTQPTTHPVQGGTQSPAAVTPTIAPVPPVQANDPALLLKAAVDAAVASASLDRTGKLAAIQGALENYVKAVKAQVDAVAPPAAGEEIAAAIEKSLGPVAEKLDLLLAKLGAPPAAVPQPKSIQALPGAAGPVQKGPGETLPVSPVTGKPSPLTARIRRSVGIVE
jgi:hypothetical protein